MDTVSLTSSLLLMRNEQTQQALSMSLLKQAAIQQNQLANMLAQNAQQAVQPVSNNTSGFNFSTYA